MVSMLLSRMFSYDFPIKTYIIVSQSMSPKINAGDLIFIRKVNFNKLEKGDIITYKIENISVTHRVIKNKGEELITKGDFNNNYDIPVKQNQVIGKYFLKIPKVGNLYYYLRNPFINIFINLVLLVLLIIVYKKDVKKENEK